MSIIRLNNQSISSVTALPSAINTGITSAQQWNFSSDVTTGSAVIFTSNWVASSNLVGSPMTESSGIFTFPLTGIYLITGSINTRNSSSADDVQFNIYTTNNNFSSQSITGAGNHRYSVASKNYQITARTLFDVTDLSNDKVKFGASGYAGTAVFRGGSDQNMFTFIRLGDT
jgi:hypothetical protein